MKDLAKPDTRKRRFLQKAQEKWGKFFDYSHSYYINSTTKILIICPLHGKFEQSPQNHLKSNGCHGCIPAKVKLDTDSFIAKAKNIWGNKYDYSKTDFKKLKGSICITCPTHGDFFIQAEAHLKTTGSDSCPHCRTENRHVKRLAAFIEQSKAIWGDQFSYDKTNYTNMSQKCSFTCKKHGDFEQYPNSHLAGYTGCVHCRNEQKKSNVIPKDEFVKKAKAVWGDRYDYCNSVYLGSNKKITIVCREHGEFTQTASHHTQGYEGCKACLKSKRAKNPLNHFVQKAKWIWGADRFDYSKVKYVNHRTNIIIICPEHGEFKQTPAHHLNGSMGCKRCLSLNKLHHYK